ncbi:MAG: hypothetical protein Q9164_007462 [Protoblastenia rupestris]
MKKYGKPGGDWEQAIHHMTYPNMNLKEHCDIIDDSAQKDFSPYLFHQGYFKALMNPSTILPFEQALLHPQLLRNGLATRVWEFPRWKDQNHSVANEDATFVFRNIDLSLISWGWTPTRWQNDQGSVLVVCLDKDAKPRDIATQQVEALCRLYQDEIMEEVLDVMEDSSYYRRRGVTTGLTHGSYRRVFESVKKERGKVWARQYFYCEVEGLPNPDAT